VAIRQTSSATFGATATVTLAIGGAAGNFAVTTQTAGVPPSAPTAVSATAGTASITVKFAPPANGGSAAITGYVTACMSTTGGSAGSNTAGAGTTSIRVSGLTNGKDYTCTVSASNPAGTSPASIPSNVVRPFDLTPILNLLLED
jgi:hypothetical protein